MEGGKGKNNKSIDTPLNSLKDSNASPKVKKTEENGVGVHSLTHNISEVKRACLNSKMGIKKSNKQVNYSHKLTQTKQQVN
jgi:hypothetical protein